MRRFSVRGRDRGRFRGFTLVELLVVITIIGILISMALPAMSKARESAFRAQCGSNIRQLGMALRAYESTFQKFPPSSVWRTQTGPNNTWKLDLSGVEGGQSGNVSTLFENWVVLILPQLDNTPLRNTFVTDVTGTVTQPISSNATATGAAGNAQSNPIARGTVLSFILCPTDSYNRTPFNGSTSPSGLTNNLGDGWAHGNYAANASLGYMGTGGTSGVGPAGWSDHTLQGIMGANASLRLDDIKDGASNTILLGEIRAGLTSYDCRGIWAMSGACPSALWCHGYIEDDNGPNCTRLYADDNVGCSDVANALGGSSMLSQLGMPCWTGNNGNVQQTARSMHPGGVNMCFADGSVHFIVDTIDCAGTSSSNLSVWDRLNLSNDGMSIDQNSY